MHRLVLLFLCSIVCQHLLAQCENRSLHFDGNGDFVTLSPLPASFAPNSDFTVQMWFRSDGTSGGGCGGNFQRLFALGGSGSRFEVGECGGLPAVYVFPGGPAAADIMSTTTLRDGNWHQISVVRDGNNLEVFLDCASIFTKTYVGTLNTTLFRLGHWGGGATPGQDWLGAVDEVRLWNYALPTADITDCGSCLQGGNETGLVAYWQLDQGVPSDLNIITQAEDATPGGNHGTLSGFSLLPGNTSNFVCSDAELVYPNLVGCSLELRGQLPNSSPLLSEICSGNPVHFCVKKDGVTPQPPPGMTIVWEHNDDGTGWLAEPNPPFIGFCFVAPSVTGDCSLANPDGFVDRAYRAKISVTDPMLGVCEYISDEYVLRICCPISPATVNIAVAQPGLLNGTLCEGDVADLTVTLNSPDPFVNVPGAATTIEWYQNGIHNPMWDNQSSFTVMGVTASVPSICFKAEVHHCSKMLSFSACITVDPVPQPGTIDKDPLCTTLEPPVSPCPAGTICYSICPGNDASLAIVSPYNECVPRWQYSFDHTTWTDMGITNEIQNTNELPGDWPWPSGFPPIYYRLACYPFHTPSGCEPEFSNEIRIEFIQPPPVDAIAGLTQICKEDGGTWLSVVVSGPYTYIWYCDGLEVQNGPSFTFYATKEACYWVDITNGCQVTQTPRHCLKVCELVAVIGCPSDCPYIGESVTLNACTGTRNTCGGDPSTFIYNWTWTDSTGTYTSTGCSITYTPPADGTTFTVMVTDPATGCTDSDTTTIVPCQI